MIYPTIKIPNTNPPAGGQISNTGEAGVTLLLSILILSAVMAIAFSIATILLVEVRVSGELVRTEPAIYAANGITEEALFTVRRGYPRCVSNCGTNFSYSKSLGSTAMQSQENLFNDPILNDTLPSTAVSVTSAKRYALYDPSDINRPSGFGQIKVKYKAGFSGQIHVYVCQFTAPQNFQSTDSPPDCNNISSSDMLYKNQGPTSQNQGLSSDQMTATMTLDPNKQQELIIFADTSPSVNRAIQIQAFDGSGSPKGLPYFGETVVDINAQSGNVTRSVRVKIPND